MMLARSASFMVLFKRERPTNLIRWTLTFLRNTDSYIVRRW